MQDWEMRIRQLIEVMTSSPLTLLAVDLDLDLDFV